MTELVWDQAGERRYETGVDKGVLYLRDVNGAYTEGHAWNGLTTVTESPSGADPNPQYADNMKYLNLLSAEEFAATIEAFTYPDAFAECDGTSEPTPGVIISQQRRKTFGLSYRTKIGNDVDGNDHGYKIHLIYGALAAPSEKAYATINDSPAAISFSWAVSTTGVPGDGYTPTALVTVDSTQVDPDSLADLEVILYGDEATDARLPLPDEVVTLFSGSVTSVRLVGSAAPAYNSGTHVVTLPNVTGVQWKINGTNKTPGAQPALTSGQTAVITAVPLSGYTITGDDDWAYDY